MIHRVVSEIWVFKMGLTILEHPVCEIYFLKLFYYSMTKFVLRIKALRLSVMSCANQMRPKLDPRVFLMNAFVQFTSRSGVLNSFKLLLKPYFKKSYKYSSAIVIVITLCSSLCLGQKTVKRPFGLRVKLPSALDLSIKKGGGFKLFLYLLNFKQEICK